jgi:hypothetical protein
MAEDDGKGSGRSRFKSKWGKVLKKSEELKSASDSFSGRKGKDLNSQEDVDDFLKPSTDRAAANRPRLDVSIAQRWPEPSELRQSGALPPDQSQNVNAWRKRRRREGLTVGFVKTVPEIIGHGGDETEDPPSDISRLKARVRGTVPVDNAISHGDHTYHKPAPEILREPKLPQISDSISSYNQAAPTHRDQNRPAHIEEPPPPPRIGISRAPTGFSAQDENWSPVSDYDDVPSLPQIPKTLDTRLAERPEQSDAASNLRVSPVPRDPQTLVASRQNSMKADEGMALRRASAMIIEPFDFESGGDIDLGSYAAATAAYRAEVAATPPTSAVDREPIIPPIDTPSPTSPDSPSPFADTNYMKRHSRDAPLAPEHGKAPPPQVSAPRQGAKSPFADPKYFQPRSNNASPSGSLRRDHMNQTSRVQAARQQPVVPEQQHFEPQQIQEASPPPPPPPEHQTRELRQKRSEMSFAIPQGPRQAPESRRDPSPDKSQRLAENYMQTLEHPSYTRAAHSTSYENVPPVASRPLPAPRMMTEPQGSPVSRDRLPPQGRPLETQPAAPRPAIDHYGSNRYEDSADRFAPVVGSPSSTGSQDQRSPQSFRSGSDGRSPPQLSQVVSSRTTSPPFQPEFGAQTRPQAYLTAQPTNSSSSLLGPPRPSPYARGPSPNGYFDIERQQPTQPARSPMASLQAIGPSRPGSAHSAQSLLRPTPPSHSPSASNLAADAAFDDFISRVSHMKGVFSLTAEKEQPADVCTPPMWVRAAYWWYLRGKTGLESLLQQRAKSRDVEHRELLLQPHVDLAKTSWMLVEPLESYSETGSLSNRQVSETDAILRRDVAALKEHLKSLSHSMLRNNIMPPHQSLIQGQDTQIWLEYPRFTPEAAAVLGGASNRRSLIMETQQSLTSPADALPLGDTSQYHYYHRSTVNLSLNTDDVSTDRVSVPCVLTVLRGQREYQNTVVIASQNELVYIKIAPRQSNSSPVAWQDVSWKASSLAITVALPRGIDATVRFYEHDFRALWNMVEHSRRVDFSLRPVKGEIFVHEAQLVEVQYADSSNAKAFPSDKVKRCRALLWERFEEFTDGGAMRRRHRGFRLAVATEPGHKALSSFTHEVCVDGPLFFEFITDAAAHGTTAMVIRISEQSRQCRMLLVFHDGGSRQTLYNKLNSIDVDEHETIVEKVLLTSLNIEPATRNAGDTPSGHSELSALQWQRLGVTNHFSGDSNPRVPDTVESDSLRIIARHSLGCITDRMNLNKGELLLRLPCTNTPAIQILRQPQNDLTMSIDARNTPHHVADGVADIFKVARNIPTIRTLTFATPQDLHAFEKAITGFTVRYDGLASNLAISRRRMVVPIYHKWTATNVRIQVVANASNSVVQLLAFMEGFAQAEALCFQIKSTDVFEAVKGDGKNKKWAVKMVDAKFTLPPLPSAAATASGREQELPAEEMAKRRFVNLEGLDYAQEHDDVTVGFESQEGVSLPYVLFLKYLVKPLANMDFSHSPRRFRKSASGRCYSATHDRPEEEDMTDQPSMSPKMMKKKKKTDMVGFSSQKLAPYLLFLA